MYNILNIYNNIYINMFAIVGLCEGTRGEREGKRIIERE
jgi:hypothetical protein